MKARLGIVGVLGLVLAILLSTTTAFAQTDDEAARAHFRSGTAYFERGDYEAALREFQAALERSGRVELLYNIASCQERLERFADAVATFDRYLREAGEIENREALQARVARLRQRVPATPPADSSLFSPDPVDDDPVDTGEEEDEQPRRGGVPLGSWISWGVGAAGLATFGVFGALTLGEDSDLESTCGTSCSPDQVSSLETYALVADIGLVVGLVGAAVGVVLLLIAPKGQESAARARLFPSRDRLNLAVHF